MLGIDASMIEVVADGGSQPERRHAGLGRTNCSWATGSRSITTARTTQVQYAWRSERKQLHLFAAPAAAAAT